MIDSKFQSHSYFSHRCLNLYNSTYATGCIGGYVEKGSGIHAILNLFYSGIFVVTNVNYAIQWKIANYVGCSQAQFLAVGN